MDKLGSRRLSLPQIIDSQGWLGSLPDQSESVAEKSCCAALYQLGPVRTLLGDTLHPGGLAMTHRLGKLVNIKRDDRVLDVACGWGTSALAVARSFHCRVVGVDLGREGIAEAARLAIDSTLDGRVSFLCGDGEYLPFSADSFDAVLCECSMSLFPDKKLGVAEMARLLRSGGRLGVSDVTVEPGCLPDELKGTLGQMLCIAEAPSVEGYRELLSGDGLTLVHEQDASDSILKLLSDIEGKIAAFRLLLSLQPPPNGDGVPGIVSQALRIVEKVKALVKDGNVGYWLFVAEKRSEG